ncbi:MAG: hypothetical protein MMC23_004446 [Stictis urceolatum]|nr:hypothetical protein [Stictis urceolata]
MKSHVQLVTSPTADTPGTCLMLHFDSKRYLLGNIHEGVQRACNQQKISMNKVSEVFLTGTQSWDNFGGMIGMILTVADSIKAQATAAAEIAKQAAARRKEILAGSPNPKLQKKIEAEEERAKAAESEPKPKFTIHGGANVLHTLATARKFIFRQGLPIYVNEHDGVSIIESELSKPTWHDSNIRVWAIPIRPRHGSTTGSAGTNPIRKRSFEDYLEADLSKVSKEKDSDPLEEEAEANRISVLRSVVSNMFDSDWRLDALVEKKLREVEVPAAIFVRNPVTKRIQKYYGPMPGRDADVPDIDVLVRRPWPGALISQLPKTIPSLTSMCYIIRNHPQRGKFLPAKAKELKVKPGSDYRTLTNGKSVQSEDGRTITPDQVMEPTKPGGGFFLAEVPSVDYLEDLFDQPHWSSLDIMEGVKTIIWILGPGVAKDPRFQEFVQKKDDLKHVISSPEHNPNRLSMDSAASAAIRHSLIDPNRYGVPRHNNLAEPLPDCLSKAVLADRALSIVLEPSFKIETVPGGSILNTHKVVEESSNEVVELAKAAREAVASGSSQAEIEKQDLSCPGAEIITLGTGSALPSKYRNVSATLVRVPGIGSYLLDCGENTLGQLSRIYSEEELLELLRDLRMIWISHLHADHHLGIASIIKAWYKATIGEQHAGVKDKNHSNRLFPPYNNSCTGRPLFIMSEPGMIEWIREYSMVEDIGYEYLAPVIVYGAARRKPASTTLMWQGQALSFHDAHSGIVEDLKSATGLEDFAAANVPHCHGAKAVSLTFPGGFKVSYSGDCRPSQDFVDIGQSSTVLIHEATFDDELKGDAKAKKHSTTSEAIGVGLAMNARRIILTHFSQRYQKIPSMNSLNNKAIRLESAAEGGEEPMAGVEPETSISVGQEPPSRPESSVGQNPEEVVVTPGNTDTKVAMAYDYMRVKVKDIASLEKFTPAFKKLYFTDKEIEG